MVHFSVSVLDAETDDPLPATAVFVEVIPHEGGEQMARTRATLDFQSLLHEAYLDIQEPGNYEVMVQIAASTEEQAQVSFDMKVISGTGFRMVITAFMGITVVVVAWFVKETAKTWGIEGWIRRRFQSSTVN
jgi:hypothetical protein